MAKRFFYLSLGILCLVAAYQLGAERARADWDLQSPGQIVGANGPGESVYTADGTAWFVDPNGGGWIRASDYQPLWDLDLPVPAEDVKFLSASVLITKTDEAWWFGWGPDEWQYVGPFPGAPVPVEKGSWGSIKGRFR
jgi:hypothetical protein